MEEIEVAKQTMAKANEVIEKLGDDEHVNAEIKSIWQKVKSGWAAFKKFCQGVVQR